MTSSKNFSDGGNYKVGVNRVNEEDEGWGEVISLLYSILLNFTGVNIIALSSQKFELCLPRLVLLLFIRFRLNYLFCRLFKKLS